MMLLIRLAIVLNLLEALWCWSGTKSKTKSERSALFIKAFTQVGIPVTLVIISISEFIQINYGG